MGEAERRKLILLREDYARFCALGDQHQYKKRWERGFGDFVQLIRIPGVESIGINWDDPAQLLVGTEVIELPDSGVVRVIGHILIKIQPPSYMLCNTTPLHSGQGNTYAHPHAKQGGVFCMTSGQQEIHNSIVDGRHSVAVAIIMKGLYLRTGTVDIGSPYSDAARSHWPAKT